MDMKAPTCFISYSWDDAEHKSWVLKLATALQSAGVEVFLDRWDLQLGMDLAVFMERSIKESQYVILICTPVFAQKANLRKGGVGYEQSVVTSEIFNQGLASTKFVPVLRRGDPATALPTFLQSRVYADFRADSGFNDSLETLLRHLHGSPLIAKPPLGPIPNFRTQEVIAPTTKSGSRIDPELLKRPQSHPRSPGGVNVPTSSRLLVSIYDGTRNLFPQGSDVLITILDGDGNILVRKDFDVSNVEFKLPFYDNSGDNYTAVAFVKGWKQTGFAPLSLSPQTPTRLDLMLVPNQPEFNFADFTWDAAKTFAPFLAPQPSENDADAKTRFDNLLKGTPRALACMLNLVTAMRGINLDGKTPVDFIRQVRWDYALPAQDRFFAYCDAGLIDAIKAAPRLFAPEYGVAAFHPGATMSWKQIQFNDANVQLTFHTNPHDCVPTRNWVTIEPDINYYKYLGTHAVMQVAYNTLTNSLTEPSQVYSLRWMECRRRGLPDFAPPYKIRAGV